MMYTLKKKNLYALKPLCVEELPNKLTNSISIFRQQISQCTSHFGNVPITNQSATVVTRGYDCLKFAGAKFSLCISIDSWIIV